MACSKIYGPSEPSNTESDPRPVALHKDGNNLDLGPEADLWMTTSHLLSRANDIRDP